MDKSKSHEQKFPKAFCELKKHDNPPNEPYFTWFVPCCPICGKSHTHGAGTTATEVSSYLGHRAAHCSGTKGAESTPGGYILVPEVRATTKKKHPRLPLVDYRLFQADLWDFRPTLVNMSLTVKEKAIKEPVKAALKAVSEAIEAISYAWARDFPNSPPRRVPKKSHPYSEVVMRPVEVGNTFPDGSFALVLNDPGNGDFYQNGDVFSFRAFDGKETLHENCIIASLVNGEHWLIESLERDHPGSNDAMVLSRFRAGYQGVTKADTVEIKGVFNSRTPKNPCSRLVFGFPKGDFSRRIPVTPESNQDMDRLRVSCGHAPYFSES